MQKRIDDGKCNNVILNNVNMTKAIAKINNVRLFVIIL